MSKFKGSDFRPACTRGGGRESEMIKNQTGKKSSSSKDKGKKGPNCKTDANKKYWLTNPKAYKQKGYEGNFKAIISKAGTKT